VNQNADFRKALETAKSEMSELMQKKSVIDQRMTKLKATIEILTGLVQEPPPAENPPIHVLLQHSKDIDAAIAAEGLNDLGITDAIRMVLTHSETPLTPTEIKTALVNAGVSLDKYVNAMSVIHNTLKRLDLQGELMTVKSPTGQTVAYTTQWVAEAPGEINLQ
jgi:hypothetical protein